MCNESSLVSRQGHGVGCSFDALYIFFGTMRAEQGNDGDQFRIFHVILQHLLRCLNVTLSDGETF